VSARKSPTKKLRGVETSPIVAKALARIDDLRKQSATTGAPMVNGSSTEPQPYPPISTSALDRVLVELWLAADSGSRLFDDDAVLYQVVDELEPADATIIYDVAYAWLPAVEAFQEGARSRPPPLRALREAAVTRYKAILERLKPRTLTIPNDSVAYDLSSAISSRKNWKVDPELREYPHIDIDTIRISVGGIVGEETGEVGDLLALGNGKDLLDPKTSIVHDLVIGRWLEAYRAGKLDVTAHIVIRVDELLEMQGFAKHHKGGFKRELKLDCLQRLKSLERIFAAGDYVNPEGKRHRLSGRLISFGRDDEYDLLGVATPYAFRIQPFAAAEVFRTTTYFANYFLALASFDTRQGVELMAYQLGRYLVWQYRVRQSHGNWSQPYCVRTLLGSSRIEIEANPSNYKRFREQFDDALDRLERKRIVGSWEYLAGDEERLPTTGWFAPWLEARVVITPPPLIVEQGAIRAAERTEHLRLAAAAPRGRTRKKVS